MTDQIMSPEKYVFETALVEQSDQILTITLNRPEKKNAINDVMSNETVSYTHLTLPTKRIV